MVSLTFKTGITLINFTFLFLDIQNVQTFQYLGKSVEGKVIATGLCFFILVLCIIIDEKMIHILT